MLMVEYVACARMYLDFLIPYLHVAADYLHLKSEFADSCCTVFSVGREVSASQSSGSASKSAACANSVKSGR